MSFGHKKYLFRGFSLTTALCLFINTAVPLWAAPVPPVSSVASSLSWDLSSVQIPTDLGRLEEISDQDSKANIFILQDAHAVSSAQRSIETLIHYLTEQYGIEKVALEGSDRELDAHFLRNFPEPKVLRAALETYTKQGELSGGAAAAIFSAPNVHYQGIEDWPLYEKGIRLYREALRKEESLLRNLNKKLDQNSEQLFEILMQDKGYQTGQHTYFDRAVALMLEFAIAVRVYQSLSPEELQILVRAEAYRSNRLSRRPAEEKILLQAQKIRQKLFNQLEAAGDLFDLSGSRLQIVMTQVQALIADYEGQLAIGSAA